MLFCREAGSRSRSSSEKLYSAGPNCKFAACRHFVGYKSPLNSSLAVQVLVGEAVQRGVQLHRHRPLIQPQGVQVRHEVAVHLAQGWDVVSAAQRGHVVNRMQ